MTVDSEAIFALMELRDHDPRALSELRGAMAAAWLDDRDDADAVPRARTHAAALARHVGRRALLRVHPPRAHDRRGGAADPARHPRGARRPSAARRRGSRRAGAALPARPALSRGRATSRPFGRRARPSRASSGSPRSRQSAPRSEPSGSTSTPSARRRSRTRYWNAVHAPRGTSSIRYTCHSERSVGIIAACFGPVGHLRQATETVARAPHPARRLARAAPRPGAPRTRPRAARCRASRTCARTATRTGASAACAARSRAVGVRPSSSPSARSCSRSSSRVRNRRGKSPAARLAAFQVPKCSMTVCGCTRALGILRELAHRRRPPHPLGCRAELLEDLLVGVAAAQTCAKCRELGLVDAHRGTLA